MAQQRALLRRMRGAPPRLWRPRLRAGELVSPRHRARAAPSLPEALHGGTGLVLLPRVLRDMYRLNIDSDGVYAFMLLLRRQARQSMTNKRTAK